MKRVLILFALLLSVFMLYGCKEEEIQSSDDYDIVSFTSYSQLRNTVKPKRSYFSFFGIFGAWRNDNKAADDGLVAPNNTSEEGIGNTSNDYSKTNVQVEGVDEADVVKNDGRYIYIANYTGVSIIDTQTNDVYKYQDEGFAALEMYLHGELLVVVGNKRRPLDYEIMAFGRGYYNYYSNSFMVRVFDISNKNDIALKREVSLENNSYINSRIIGDDIFFLLQSTTYDYAREQVNIPTYTDSLLDNESHQLPLENIKYIKGETSYYSYNNLVSFNIVEEKDVNIDAYIGNFYNVYSSQNNFYVANPVYRNFNYGVTIANNEDEPETLNSSNVNTLVYRFEIVDGKLVYQAKNTVPGRILNQFSMDEHNDYFRIVTTRNNDSAAYVLSLNDDFEIVSYVDGIGIGESVYSVRFVGDRGYVVTFFQIDPLYIIDFSNPLELSVISELKSPGVSDYLHYYNDDLLIGVGRNIVDNRNFGVKISLFNISDEANPIEVDIFYADGEYSYTELQYNHKALIEYRKLNIIALPIYSYGALNNFQYIQGMYVFKIDEIEQTVTLLGVVSNYANPNNYDSYVTRGVIINDYLYSISSTKVYVNDLNNDMHSVKIIDIK